MKPVMSLRALAALSIALCVTPFAWAPRNNTLDQIALRLANGENLKIVIYGTSLSANGAWVKQIQDNLAERYPGRAEWINTSGSGKNSDWGIENVQERVVRHQPDVVIIEFAINDSVARFNISLSKAESNLRRIVSSIRKGVPSVQIVLQTTNPVLDRPPGHDGHRRELERYYNVVRKVAKELDLHLSDQAAAWQHVLNQGPNRFRRLVPDGLHPNAEGSSEVSTPTLLDTLGAKHADAVFQQHRTHDILVYGGTSGAVTAAIQAKRMGKQVLLVSPDPFLGGLTSNGLGWTDLGDARTIGGLSREFYQRIYEHYGKPDSWVWQAQTSFRGQGQGAPARDDKTRTMWTFEPHVAERTFRQMIEEAKVPVVYGRLDLDGGVLKRGDRIVGIRTTDRNIYSAITFIDATYEGDLMAGAGVSFTTGRESNSKYGETMNGNQMGRAIKNQIPKGVSPYRKKDNPKSGLLPGIEPATTDLDGLGDERIQAYCYRMCLTNLPENRVRITKPKGYRASDYELVFRSLEAGQTADFFKLDTIPNRKTDSNNTGGVSTDFIGRNYRYPNAPYDERERIANAHRDWQLGLIWTLQNHPRVPENIRKRYADWGLPRDEFPENGHWPRQIYVREARRMLADVVIDENSLVKKLGSPFSAGMGSYKMDSHNVRRIVGPDGFVMNEGDVQESTKGPYAIDYRAMLPKASECSNLIVPICLSASHIAYGSIRMEPVFMILGQTAATLASMSVDEYKSVQTIDYQRLANRLKADQQVLNLP